MLLGSIHSFPIMNIVNESPRQQPALAGGSIGSTMKSIYRIFFRHNAKERKVTMKMGMKHTNEIFAIVYTIKQIYLGAIIYYLSRSLSTSGIDEIPINVTLSFLRKSFYLMRIMI